MQAVAITPPPESLLGRGLSAEVYAWGPPRALKLFVAGIPRETAQHEFTVTRAIHQKGHPAPEVHDVVQVGERWAIVLERVDGISMVRQVQLRPWLIFRAARLLASLHAQLHNATAPPELPCQRERFQRDLREAASLLPPDELRAAKECLTHLPEGDSLCHGDFHPENVLLTGGGPVIIDWPGATRGNADADAACTVRLIEEAPLPHGLPWHVRSLVACCRRLLRQLYVKEYLRLRGGTPARIEAWRPVQKAAALAWRKRHGACGDC